MTQTPVLAAVKAVDPAKYPFYGTLTLQPDMPLASALTDDRVAVGEDLLIRLRLKVGEVMRIGTAISGSRHDRLRTGSYVGHHEHRSAADDVAQRYERAGLMQARKPRYATLPVQARAECATGGTSPPDDPAERFRTRWSWISANRIRSSPTGWIKRLHFSAWSA